MTDDEISQRNILLGKQIQELIQTLFGHSRPFVTILPGLPDEGHGGIVSNIDGDYLTSTLNEALSHSSDAGTFFANEGKESFS